MIDEDIRHIIEPELIEGESLIWAEKTSLEARLEWAKSKLKSDQDTFKMLIGISIFLIVMMFGFDSWRSDKRILVLIPFTIIVSIGLLGAVLHPQKRVSKYLRQREIGGYALSNFKFYTLGLSLAISEGREAKEIRSAKPFRQMPRLKWITTNLTLTPVGTGWLRWVELYFLEDFQASANYINSKIQREHTP